MNESRARALLDQHFVDALTRERFEELRAHLQGCADCRARYDRLFGLEAHFDGGKGEAERIGTRLFGNDGPVRAALRWLGLGALALFAAGAAAVAWLA